MSDETRMKPEIKDLWVKALRSGDYKQTQGILQRTERGRDGEAVGFCCLGVLCDLAVKAGIVEAVDMPEPDTGEKGVVGYPDTGEKGVVGYRLGGDESIPSIGSLPYEVQQWAGLTDPDEGNDPMIDGMTLSYYNDGEGYDFKRIASLIEKEL